MHDRKWVKLDELREPAMRRVVEATKRVEDETPGLLGALLRAAELDKRRGEVSSGWPGV
jgi:hypothetical protein